MIEQINSKIAKEMGLYKQAYRKYKIAEGNDRQVYRLKMDVHIKRIKNLLKEKEFLKC